LRIKDKKEKPSGSSRRSSASQYDLDIDVIWDLDPHK
jgi:hypothetical protein